VYQAPQFIQGVHGQQFQQYPLEHPANLKPTYRHSKKQKTKQPVAPSAFARAQKEAGALHQRRMTIDPGSEYFERPSLHLNPDLLAQPAEGAVAHRAEPQSHYQSFLN